jgi:hypothetical protein
MAGAPDPELELMSKVAEVTLPQPDELRMAAFTVSDWLTVKAPL